MTALLAACGGGTSKQSSGAGSKNALGVTLPAGSAPASDQYYVQPFDSTGVTYKAMDFYETVYSRAPLADQFTIPLVRLTKNYGIVPAAATSWEQSSDGKSWTFHLRKGINWSDGAELTAADFVETLRYSADPKHAWDFAWFWSGVIKNYTEAVAGKVPTSEIGVRQGADKYTLVFESDAPVAFMPSACLYTTPLSAAALHKHGSGQYNIDPATSVTCGDYALKTFEPTSTVVLEPNKKYSGPIKPPIAGLVAKIYAGGDMLPRFQTGEVDTINAGPIDVKAASRNSQLKKLHLYKNPQDFKIWYVFFDVTKSPFDKLEVRQAFAHSVDRDPLVNNILAPLASPAYGYLMPGYPFAIGDELKQYTNYDPTKAKSLLAQAGYPNGQGFPAVTFDWFPNAAASSDSVVQALVENWNKVLGINIKLQQIDQTTFYDRMNKKPTEITMGMVSYGMDYFDASNMLSVYKSNGRHNWNNKQYDDLLAQGAAESDKTKRQEIYTKAQVLLTQQAPAVFIFHPLYGYYYGPYMQGAALTKNDLGYDGIQWPGFSPTSDSMDTLHVASNVSDSKRQPQTLLGS
ncbi:peptide ABC transporter substrate-binding protein [Microlunatus endophyticus]